MLNKIKVKRRVSFQSDWQIGDGIFNSPMARTQIPLHRWGREGQEK